MSKKNNRNKIHGINAEKRVAKRFKLNKTAIKTSNGIDIPARSIEVKSAQIRIKEGNKKRTGRFYIKPNDLKEAKRFAFVYGDNIEIISSKQIIKYLKSQKLWKGHNKVYKLSITTLKKIK